MASNTEVVAELGPSGFGTCELTAYGYSGPECRFELRYTFPTANEDFNPGRVIFERALAYRWTSYPALTVDVSAAMDMVVEIGNSAWVADTKKNGCGSSEYLGRTSLSEIALHHYMVYFDERGCLEILAQSAQVVNKTEAANA